MKKTILLIGLVSLLLMGIALGSTITLNYPNANYFGRTIQLNATVAGIVDDGYNVTNATFEYKLNADSDWIRIGVNTSSAELNASQFTFGWSANALNDTNTYDFRARYQNETGDYVATSSTASLIPDATVPVCSPSVSSNTDYDPTVNTSITLTATNASGNCNGYFTGTGYSSFVKAVSSGACAFPILNTIAYGKYTTLAFDTTDGLNMTTCSVTGVSFTQKSSGGANLQNIELLEGSQIPASSGTGTNTGIIAIIIVIIIIIVLFNLDKFK